jgi:aspartyl-tRNA(Asn)/glutamyl-tRNA(Gln) amidotransferase subunit A
VTDSVSKAQKIFENKRKKARDANSLVGIPFTIKDNVFVTGYKTTAACVAFKDFFPTVNGDIFDSFTQAGAVPLGKTNLHELALGPTCSASFFGPVRNPVDSSRVTGGSSGGSAVSVAKAKYAIATIGSDTGGSIRIPAALCGICGFKPSINTISSFGVFPLSATLDTMGVLARTMEDLIVTLSAISPAAFANRSKTKSQKRKKKLGIPGKRYFDGADNVVTKNFWKAVDKLREDYEIIEGIGIPDEERVSRVRRSIMLREGAWFYSEVIRNPEYRKQMDSSVLAAFDAGAKMGEVERMQSELARVSYVSKMFSLFKAVDFVVMPSVHLVAPKLEDMLDTKKYAVARALLISNPEMWNLCGFPALSLPTHRLDSASLPTGIQIAGEYGNDVEVLETGTRIWDTLHS